MFRIRPFQPDDFNAVIEIEWQVFKEHDPYMYMKLYESLSDGFYVAVDDGEVIGYVVGFISYPKKGRIFTLAVREKYRGMGIGTMLIEKIYSVLKKNGAKEIHLEVRLSNTSARQFYLKHGFMPVWVEQGYYNDGEDALIMEKEL